MKSTSHLPLSTDEWWNISFTPVVLSQNCEEDIWQPDNTKNDQLVDFLFIMFHQNLQNTYKRNSMNTARRIYVIVN